MMTERLEKFIFILVGIFLLAMGLLQPYFESRAYNKLTGAHTTYWDAVWLKLRVQDRPQP
jgi:hypothetical protein